MLEKLGLPPLDIVSPSDCIPQDVNARYMDPSTIENLIANIKKDGRLESTPLVEPAANGKYMILSGHHRVEASQKAHLPHILVMITEPESPDEARAKQLSHNAIVGKDDQVLRAKMYASITDIQAKLYSGLQDQLEPIQTVTLAFRPASFQEFLVAFMPEDIEDFDNMVELVGQMPVKSTQEVRVTSKEYYAEFCRAIRQVKKVENIKSSGAALARIIELAKERLEEIKDEQTDENE